MLQKEEFQITLETIEPSIEALKGAIEGIWSVTQLTDLPRSTLNCTKVSNHTFFLKPRLALVIVVRFVSVVSFLKGKVKHCKIPKKRIVPYTLPQSLFFLAKQGSENMILSQEI